MPFLTISLVSAGLPDYTKLPDITASAAVKNFFGTISTRRWGAIWPDIWKINLQEGSIRIVSDRLVVGQIVDSDYFCDLTQTDGLTALW